MIVSIGELLADLITTQPVNSLAEARTLEVKPGGSPANFAAYCHKLGAAVTLVAAVGADGLGNRLLQQAVELGIDTEHIHQLPERATSLIVIGSHAQTPEFVAYRDADLHIPAIGSQLIQRCSLLHSTAFALSKEPAQTHILQAMQEAVAQGKPVSVDWNYSPKIWGTNNNAPEVFAQLMQLKPLLKLSMDDVCRFWGETITVETAMQRVAQFTTTAACITCGADGVWYRQHNEPWQHQPARPVKVTDATGAGDSFWSGFITSYLKALTMEQCIINALEVASLKLQNKF